MVRKAVRPLSAVMADFAAVDAKEARVRAFFEPITDKVSFVQLLCYLWRVLQQA
jgi:hypothetical protein